MPRTLKAGSLNGGGMAPVSTEIIGAYLSPYVQKVLVCLDIKGIPYEIDPIVPFHGNDEFARLSPVRMFKVNQPGAAG